MAKNEEKNDNPGRAGRPGIGGCPTCHSHSVSRAEQSGLFACGGCGAKLMRRESRSDGTAYYMRLDRPDLETVTGTHKKRAANVTEN